MINNQVSCICCRKQLAIRQFGNHLRANSCKEYSEIVIEKKPDEKRVKALKTCMFCGCTYKETAHSFFCKSNPAKNERSKSNQHIKALETGIPVIYTEEFRNSTSERFKGRKHTVEARNKMSISARLNVTKNPELYTGRYNRGYVRPKLCSNGFTVLGGWEEKFVEFCILNKIDVTQPNTGFSYIHNNHELTYHPDFYLPDIDIWIEIKGYKTEKDVSKWASLRGVHNKRLLVIDKKHIHELSEIIDQLQ